MPSANGNIEKGASMYMAMLGFNPTYKGIGIDVRKRRVSDRQRC
jgi:hypothetical protein